jgi:hypothetical protein
LIAAAHRLDNLIHHRRMALAASVSPTSAPPLEKSGQPPLSGVTPA